MGFVCYKPIITTPKGTFLNDSYPTGKEKRNKKEDKFLIDTYTEIKEKLQDYKKNSSTGELKVVQSVETLFRLCQQYWSYRPENFDEVIPSLMDKVELNTTSNRKNELTITQKLYIEFLYKIYLAYYGDSKNTKDRFHIFANKRNNTDEKFRTAEIKKLMKGVFIPEKVNDLDVDMMKEAVDAWKDNVEYEVYFQNLHMENLHRVMHILQETFDTPNQILPDEKYCIEKTLTPVFLENLNSWLSNDANVPLVLFNLAPITRALYDGRPYSYTMAKTRNENRSYIQDGIVKNYKYIKKYYDAIRELYDEYMDTYPYLCEMWENTK